VLFVDDGDILTAAGSAAALRRETGITPSAYRRRFGPEVN
jgi:AraC-like DNA-binding protein